ncbi:MAG: hypothetical protein [Cressdnaviricota sp.]|nr:MAG: hypothetical protein [Cressdnaviricota sp.]
MVASGNPRQIDQTKLRTCIQTSSTTFKRNSTMSIIVHTLIIHDNGTTPVASLHICGTTINRTSTHHRKAQKPMILVHSIRPKTGGLRSLDRITGNPLSHLPKRQLGDRINKRTQGILRRNTNVAKNLIAPRTSRSIIGQRANSLKVNVLLKNGLRTTRAINVNVNNLVPLVATSINVLIRQGIQRIRRRGPLHRKITASTATKTELLAPPDIVPHLMNSRSSLTIVPRQNSIERPRNSGRLIRRLSFRVASLSS